MDIITTDLSLVIIAQRLLCLTEHGFNYEQSLLFFTVFKIIGVILYNGKHFFKNFRILTGAESRLGSRINPEPGRTGES
ncbi:hypothetical protein [Microcoleus sp. bin38.metabat.b11b12b14.051]|uniref:hypothetical protein n=1 Tax=Microcoleus sp. bin38.metabat.b11b12b14.051 TaxID=2742709 RepID=UPI0025F32F86|nr:hypothetical protein [Microcoleus sp. bin38.metabat.b11b12b14.051]